jgi:hypothetical protein
MEVRTTVAALLLLLAAAAHATDAAGPAYTQAADLAAGRTPATVGYDGSAARLAVQEQVGGALTTGGLTVPAVQPSVARNMLAPHVVPPPAESTEKPAFFSGHSLMFGAGGAAVGAAAGWFLGGPIGALIGAAAGFAIGFLLSKFLH